MYVSNLNQQIYIYIIAISRWPPPVVRFMFETKWLITRCGNKEHTRPFGECAPPAAKTKGKQGKFILSYSMNYCGICSKNPVVQRREIVWAIMVLLWWYCGGLVASLSHLKLGA